MNPQPFTDLAERFALIIEGLCKVISAQRRGFLTRFILHLLPSRSRLLCEQLAELAALIRSGKLLASAPLRPHIEGDRVSSRPSCSKLASAGPARSRAGGGLWPAGRDEAEDS